MEIERKFLIKYLPDDLGEAIEIWQGYFEKKKGVEKRVRKAGNKYFSTIKKGVGLIREEIEREISEKEFLEGWERAECRLKKKRYKKKIMGKIFEIDEYLDDLNGKVVAEVELDAAFEEVQIDKMDWILREVTGEEKYSNYVLAKRGWPK